MTVSAFESVVLDAALERGEDVDGEGAAEKLGPRKAVARRAVLGNLGMGSGRRRRWRGGVDLLPAARIRREHPVKPVRLNLGGGNERSELLH